MGGVTILTSPIGDERWRNTGHYAVTRSLLTGLERIGYKDYNYQPETENELYDNLHVLFGIPPCDTLQYGYNLHSAGKVKVVTAGPNVFNFPFEQGGAIEDSRLEKYLVPSEWFRNMFALMCPPAANKLYSWPCGVDSNILYLEHTRKNKAIIYKKGNQSNEFYADVINIVKRYGYEVEIFSYGKYNYDDYIKALGQASFVVAVSDTESQGLYLAEAWAMDVPTICFEPGFHTWPESLYGIEITWPMTSTCPYLSEYTGVRFKNIEELKMMINHADYIIDNTAPREWVSKNMTDEICAQKFLNIIES